jgi:hypothetical protein
MTNLIILLVSSITGSIGWWLGAYINLEFAFVLSTIGSIVGIFYGWKWSRALF